MKCRLIVAILAVLALLPGCSKEEMQNAVVGKPAPAFSLKTPDGRTVSLTDFSGKAVVIDFWTTWCHACKESTREFEALHKKYRGRGVVMIGISMDKGADALDQVRKFVRENNVTYLILMDDGRTSDAYGVRTIPATFILDKNHVLVKTYPGYLPGLGERISKEVAGLL
jgi:peroxiredoxin